MTAKTTTTAQTAKTATTWLVVLLFLSVPSVPARAKEPGRTGLPILELPTGARPAVLGPGFAALADDLYAIHYNAAGLSLLERHEASFAYLKGVSDTSVAFGSYGRPLPFPGLLNNGYPAMAAGIMMADHGTIEVNRTNADGSFRDSRRLKAGQDTVATLAYSERLGDDTLRGGRNIEFFFGLSAKHIISVLAEDYKAETSAADAGLLVRLSQPKLTLGMSVLNFGRPIQYLAEPDPLPLTYRVALGWSEQTVFDHQLQLVGGADYSAYAKRWRAGTGLEFLYQKIVAFRAGYQLFGDDLMDYSAGIGFLQESFRLDYAWLPQEALNDQHRVTFSYRFGTPTGRKIQRQRIRDLESAPRDPNELRQRRRDANPGGGIIVPGWE